MVFPVDVLVSLSHGDLESSAHHYMTDLLYSDPEHAHYFTLSSGRKVQISLSNVGFVPLYGANLKHKVLALFAPEDQFTAVALFLANQWYAVDDILKTSEPARNGLLKVRSVAERIVLYVLNRIVYRTNEMGSGEVPFLCHAENDYAKIFWKNGEAVGFYSVKPKGSVCNNFLSQCYLLPVMDSIFVRKGHRGHGYGLQMLEDFVDCFKEDELGLKFPLSPAMSKVCRCYLDTYPADVDLLWEVEGIGGPYQRTRVATKLSSKGLQGGLHFPDENSSKNGDVPGDESEMTKEASLDITEDVVINKHLKVAEEMDDTPISTRTRSSEHRRRKREREDDGSISSENQPEKIIRVEEHKTDSATELVADISHTEGEKGEDEELTPVEEATDDSVVPEAPAAEQQHEELEAPEMNGEVVEDQLAELKEEEKEADKEAVESAQTQPVLQNGTAGEEEEQMDVEERTEEKDPDVTSAEQEALDTVDNPEEPSSVELEALEQNQEKEIALLSEEEQEVEIDQIDKEQNKEKLFSAVEDKSVAPDKQEDEAPHTAEEKKDKEVDPAGEEKPEQGVSEAEEKQEDEVAPAAEEKQKVDLVAEEEDVMPDAEEKQQEEVEHVAGEKNNIAPDAEEDLEEEEAFATEVRKEPELIPAGEPSPDNQSEQEEAMDVEEPPGEKEETSDSSKEPPAEEDSGESWCFVEKDFTNMEPEKLEETVTKAERKEDKDRSGDVQEERKMAEADNKSSDETSESPGPDIRILRGGRVKAVPPTPKRTAKRPSKGVVVEVEEEEEEEQSEMIAEDEEKVASTEEEKVTTEEEVEHSSGEGQEEEPPVIDRRVLRRKTKLILSTPQPKAKRRNKI